MIRARCTTEELDLATTRVVERANALARLRAYVEALHRKTLTTGKLPTLDEVTRLLELTKELRA